MKPIKRNSKQQKAYSKVTGIISAYAIQWKKNKNGEDCREITLSGDLMDSALIKDGDLINNIKVKRK